MKLLLYTFRLLFCTFLSLIVRSTGFGMEDYKNTIPGEGTYYGFTTGGNCAMRGELPSMYKGMVPIAINDEQYADSMSCGACLEVEGTGRGIGGTPIRGKFKAFVHDRCPECKKGDVDLSQSGDGRWEVKIKFIPCPNDNEPSFLFEGSNGFYKKLQFRGGKYPVTKMSIDGIPGFKSQDNFFIAMNGGGFRGTGTVVMSDLSGRSLKATMNLAVADGVVKPQKFEVGGETKRKPSPRPRPRKPSKKPSPSPRPRRPHRGKCVPRGKYCGSTKRNIWRTSKCCRKGYHCRHVKWSKYRRCARKLPQKPKRCIPRYKYCSGPWKRRGNSCCGKYVCRHSSAVRYMRCLPRRKW